jgi:hypothetical protein
MASPNSRETFKEYCLRALGAPVLQINVDPDQLDDRVDDAVQKFQEYHDDGTIRTFLKHQITDSDMTNGWIPISEDVQIVKALFPVRGNTQSASFWNLEYQMHLNDLAHLSSFTLMADLAYYTQTKQYLEMINLVLNGYPQVNFSQSQRRLYIHADLEDGTLEPGQWLVVEAYNYINPDTWSPVWNENWLKQYAIALIKKQWGTNMKKFDGIQSIGGVTINGQQMYDEAIQAIEKLEEDLRSSYEMPPDFMVG